MKNLIKPLAAVALSLGGLTLAQNAAALDTEVAFSGTADGNYTVTGITSFDWQDTSSLVIDGTSLVWTDSVGDGHLDSCTGANNTLTCFFANAVSGDTLTYDIYAQTVLTGFTSGSPDDTDGGNLNSTGSGGGYEVTAAMSATETAVYDVNVLNQPILYFVSIDGTIEFFYDSSPDADAAAGTGFIDGTSFLTADINSVSGSYNGGSNNGSSFLDARITSYDPDYIEADNPLCTSAGTCLIGNSFDSTIDITFGVAPALANGNNIGLSPQHAYDNTADLLLAHDTTTQFVRIPEPGTVLLLGIGMLGLGQISRKNKK